MGAFGDPRPYGGGFSRPIFQGMAPRIGGHDSWGAGSAFAQDPRPRRTEGVRGPNPHLVTGVGPAFRDFGGEGPKGPKKKTPAEQGARGTGRESGRGMIREATVISCFKGGKWKTGTDKHNPELFQGSPSTLGASRPVGGACGPRHTITGRAVPGKGFFAGLRRQPGVSGVPHRKHFPWASGGGLTNQGPGKRNGAFEMGTGGDPGGPVRGPTHRASSGGRGLVVPGGG